MCDIASTRRIVRIRIEPITRVDTPHYIQDIAYPTASPSHTFNGIWIMVSFVSFHENFHLLIHLLKLRVDQKERDVLLITLLSSNHLIRWNI